MSRYEIIDTQSSNSLAKNSIVKLVRSKSILFFLQFRTILKTKFLTSLSTISTPESSFIRILPSK